MFNDPDPLEQDMGILCEDMSPDQLVSYIKSYQDAFDRRLAVDGFIERSVFKSMQRIYGPKTAGHIVKWAFYRHKGIWRDEVITFTSFAKGRKWWVDLLHQELQAHLRKETVKKGAPVTVGAKRLSDL